MVVIDKSWKMVFNFAIFDVITEMPISFKNNLNRVTKISLKNISKTIQGSTIPARLSIYKKIVNADKVNILSASGSKNVPNLETTLNFLASFPSRASVMEATIKINKA